MLLLTLMISACGNEESATKDSGSAKKNLKRLHTKRKQDQSKFQPIRKELLCFQGTPEMC